MWNLLSLAQLIELVPISRHPHQHNIESINQAQHKPSGRVKISIKNIKKSSTHMRPNTVVLSEMEFIAKEIISLYGTNIKTQFSHLIYIGWNCSFLTSSAIMGVKMGEMSKLG
jgi:hypothetical protein